MWLNNIREGLKTFSNPIVRNFRVLVSSRKDRRKVNPYESKKHVRREFFPDMSDNEYHY